MGAKKTDKGFSVFPRQEGGGRTVYVVKYKTDAGWKQHRLDGVISSEAQAERVATAWLATQRADGKLGQGFLFEEVEKKWTALRRANPKVAKSTAYDNESHLRTWLAPEFKGHPFGQIQPQRVRELVQKMAAAGRAPHTIRNVISTLSTMIDDAMAEGWIPKGENPANHPIVQKAMPELQNVAGQDVIWLPLPEAQKLIESPALPADRRARYFLAFVTGLRDGELSGLLWEDIALDAETPFLRVRKALALRAEEGRTTAAIAKTKTTHSNRIVPLHPAAVAALRWWFARGWFLHVGREPLPTDPVLPNANGLHWRPKSAFLFRDDLEAAGCAKDCDGHPITFHATRRSFATWLADAGVDQETRSRLLGHRPPSVEGRHYSAPVLARQALAIRTIRLEWPAWCALGAAAPAHHERTTAAPANGGATNGASAHLDGAGSDAEPAENEGERAMLDMAADSGMFAPPERQAGHLSSVVEQRFRKPSDPTTARRDEAEDAGELPRSAPTGHGSGRNEARARRTAHQYAHQRERRMLQAHQAELKVARLFYEAVELAIEGASLEDPTTVYAAAADRLRKVAEMLADDPVGAQPIVPWEVYGARGAKAAQER